MKKTKERKEREDYAMGIHLAAAAVASAITSRAVLHQEWSGRDEILKDFIDGLDALAHYVEELRPQRDRAQEELTKRSRKSEEP